MPQRFNGLLDRLIPADNMGGLLAPMEAQAAQRQAQMMLGAGLLQGASPSRMPTSLGGLLGAALPQAMQFQSERQTDALRNQQMREAILERNKQKAAQEKLMGLLDLAGDEGQVIGLLGQVEPGIVVKGLLDRYLAPTQPQGPESPIGKLFADRDALAARGNTEGVKAIDAVIQREMGVSGADLEDVRGARNDVIRNSEAFLEAQKGFQSVLTGATSNTPAGDVALVFGFMKTLDPRSTVREGEFATAENTRGVPDTIRGIYNKIISGQRLTPEQRSDFAAQSRAQFSKVRDQHQRLIDDARSFAERNRLNVLDVVPNYLLPQDLPEIQQPPPAAPTPPRSWGAPLLPQEQDALGRMLQNLGLRDREEAIPPLPPGFTLDQ
jgi:hypothetical protein